MNIFEALTLCKTGRKVRPQSWAETNPLYWVESRTYADTTVIFVECGHYQEMPHRLFLQFEAELLGPWEVLP